MSGDRNGVPLIFSIHRPMVDSCCGAELSSHTDIKVSEINLTSCKS